MKQDSILTIYFIVAFAFSLFIFIFMTINLIQFKFLMSGKNQLFPNWYPAQFLLFYSILHIDR